MELTRYDGGVYVLDLGDGENRVDAAFIASFREALDAVGAEPVPRALVSTGSGRFYSNGLDLESLGGLDPVERARLMADFEALLADLLAASFVTVAGVNGHCYAAGALIALAHDLRMMRADRGFFCLPSVDVGIPFTTGMTRLITAKVPPPLSHTLVVTGNRIGGEEALDGGVVSSIHPADRLLPEAISFARAAADKDPATLGAIKARMFGDLIDRLTAT